MFIPLFTFQYSIVFAYFPMNNVLYLLCFSLDVIVVRIEKRALSGQLIQFFCLHNLHIGFDQFFNNVCQIV